MFNWLFKEDISKQPSNCPDPDAVCAYEYEGVLYKSKEAIEAFKIKKELGKLEDEVFELLVHKIPCSDFNYPLLSKYQARRLSEILIENWKDISVKVDKAFQLRQREGGR